MVVYKITLATQALRCAQVIALFFLTDLIQNNSVVDSTNSTLSSVSGPEMFHDSVGIPRGMRHCALTTSTYDILNREFQFTTDTIRVSPLSLLNSNFILADVVSKNTALANVMKNFTYFSYDGLDLRVTLSAPKSLVGSAMIAMIPAYDTNLGAGRYTDVFTQINDFHLKSMARSSWSIPLGIAQDLQFTFPWTFRSPVMMTNIFLCGLAPSDYFTPGMPLLSVGFPKVVSVTEQLDTYCDVRIYAKFINPKLYGPASSMYQAQSGTFGAVGATIGTAFLKNIAAPIISDTASTLAEGFCSTTGLCATEQARAFVHDVTDSFSKPSFFMPSIVGDTTSQSKAPPGFRASTAPLDSVVPVEVKKQHRIDDFLKRPQYVTTIVDDSSHRMTNDPFKPLDEILDLVSWFSYFGQIARYYTGSLNVHLQVCGHPMVETELTVARGFFQGLAPTTLVNYPSLLDQPSAFTTYDFHREVFSSSKTFVINVPFASTVEVAPVLVKRTGSNTPYFRTTYVDFRLKTYSSAIGPLVHMPYNVFISAGPDFRLLDPRPMNNYFFQASLLPDGNTTILSSDEHLSSQTTLMPIETVEQLCSIWNLLVPNGNCDSTIAVNPVLPQLVYPVPVPMSTNASVAVDPTLNPAVCDYITHLSRLFVCFRGSIYYKFLVDVEAHDPDAVVGISYADPVSGRTVKVCKRNIALQQLPEFLNPSAVAAFTIPRVQPVLEFAYTYRGSNALSYVSPALDAQNTGKVGAINTRMLNQLNSPLNHNLIFDSVEQDPVSLLYAHSMRDIIWRKVSTDFELFIEVLPPAPSTWMVSATNNN